MIDIHSHIIPFVDDGSRSLERSIELVKAEKAIGVTDIICTPHAQKRSFNTPLDKVIPQFEKLKQATYDLGVNLHLGQEIATNRPVSDKIALGELCSMANSRYVLLEFDYNNFVDINEIVYEMSIKGYLPIIAHVERITYANENDIREFISSGAFIQVNADSLKGLFNHYRKKVTSLLKLGLVDFIASDIHDGRVLFMKEAYDYINKKYGAKTAKKIFVDNPKCVLNDEKIR